MSFHFPGSIRRKLIRFPTLETERLILRKIGERDVKDMFEYARDPETSRYLLWEPHPDPAFTLAHIRRLQRQYKALTFFDWALVEKKSRKMIGTAGFTAIHDLTGSAEIGYVLSPAYQRQGLAPEAVRAVLTFGFDTLGLDSVTCRIMEDNVASRKVAGRLGFTPLGFEREPLIKRGQRQRVARYRLMAEQFRAKREKEQD
ncbi:MAG: GNAT family N-acetyltransferase [Clostridia bacterium]|nr:GNAT family N-acetyltransferase [Clostridia bacterium]